jgi:anti-anti-sigma factor
MSLIPDTHPAWPVARITGDIDLSNVEEWTATLEAAVPNHALGLVVDLSGVTYLDSTGIRLLFRLARRLRDRQQTLHLVVPDGARIVRILELSGVSQVATTTSSIPDLAVHESN